MKKIAYWFLYSIYCVLSIAAAFWPFIITVVILMLYYYFRLNGWVAFFGVAWFAAMAIFGQFFNNKFTKFTESGVHFMTGWLKKLIDRLE